MQSQESLTLVEQLQALKSQVGNQNFNSVIDRSCSIKVSVNMDNVIYYCAFGCMCNDLSLPISLVLGSTSSLPVD